MGTVARYAAVMKNAIYTASCCRLTYKKSPLKPLCNACLISSSRARCFALNAASLFSPQPSATPENLRSCGSPIQRARATKQRALALRRRQPRHFLAAWSATVMRPSPVVDTCNEIGTSVQLSHSSPVPQAARIIANLIIAGGGVLIRAAAQAYRQALISASLPCLDTPPPLHTLCDARVSKWTRLCGLGDCSCRAVPLSSRFGQRVIPTTSGWECNCSCSAPVVC